MPQEEVDLLIRCIPYEPEGTGARVSIYRVPPFAGPPVPGGLVASTRSLNDVIKAVVQALALCQGQDPKTAIVPTLLVDPPAPM